MTYVAWESTWTLCSAWHAHLNTVGVCLYDFVFYLSWPFTDYGSAEWSRQWIMQEFSWLRHHTSYHQEVKTTKTRMLRFARKPSALDQNWDGSANLFLSTRESPAVLVMLTLGQFDQREVLYVAYEGIWINWKVLDASVAISSAIIVTASPCIYSPRLGAVRPSPVNEPHRFGKGSLI